MTSKWTPGPSRHRKQIQVLPKATQNGDKPAKVSKAIPKAAKVHQKSSKGAPKTPERLQKDIEKLPKSTPKGIPKRLLNRTPNLRPLFPLNVSKT